MTAPRPRPVRALLAANLRRLSRDRVGLFFIVVMPLVVTALVGLALGGRAGGTAQVPVGLVVQAHGATAAALVDGLQARPDLEVERVATPEELAVRVKQGSLAAGLILPASLDAEPLPAQLALPFVTTQTGGTATAARTALATVVAQQQALLEATRVARSSGASAEQAEQVVRAALSEQRGVSVSTATSAAGAAAAPQGFAFTAPANLLLFTFINSIAVAGALVETRRLGLSKRMLVSPLRRGRVLCGEAVSRYVVAAAQALLVVLATRFLFGVHWGSPLAVGLLVAAFCLVATGAAVLTGSLLRSGTQASAIGPPLGIILGALGGTLWPAEVNGPVIDGLGHLFPHAWAMDGLLRLSVPGAGVGDVLVPLAVLLAMGATLLALAMVLFGRAMRR